MTAGRYLAIIYREVVDEKGNVTLQKVTTARWLTVPQAAASLGVSDKTIYRQIEEGALKVSRVGASIRIAVDDFVAYAQARREAEYERPEKEEARV